MQAAPKRGDFVRPNALYPSKSNHNDTYRENNRKIQRKIRLDTNPPQLRETNIVFHLHFFNCRLDPSI